MEPSIITIKIFFIWIISIQWDYIFSGEFQHMGFGNGHCERMPLLLLYCLRDKAPLIFEEWNEARYNTKGIPQGTMGWPIFGETAAFLSDGPEFMKRRRARYGNLFKTHALGSPTVICMDPELNRYILLNEAQGLIPGYPKSMRTILGDSNVASVHISEHKRIRGSMLSLTGSVAIKNHLLSQTDSFMRSFLTNWDAKTIDIQEKTTEMAFLVGMKQMADSEPMSYHKALRKSFDELVKGVISLPIYLPGTDYYRGLQGRKAVVAMLRELLEKRRASSESYGDMFDLLIKNEEFRYKLNDDEIIDQIITVLYSGYETVSTTTMMCVKYLHDHPKALQQIRDEHFAIRENKNPEDAITWEELKKMTFTRAVILETSRLASIVNGLLRLTANPVQFNGFTIPKGWKVYVYMREMNHDPIVYPEPYTFSPWRWVQDNGLESNSHNLMFGGGGRQCPGKELGIVKVSLFLHYFLTQYRWEEKEGNELKIFPRVIAPNGLYLKVSNYSK